LRDADALANAVASEPSRLLPQAT
jgi:hypothetical protein